MPEHDSSNGAVAAPWYALYTKHHHEQKVARVLDLNDLDTLLPPGSVPPQPQVNPGRRAVGYDSTKSLLVSVGKRSGEVKLAQHGAFLFLVVLHAFQDIYKNRYRGHRVRTFVEHYALSPLAHGGIRDF